MTIDDGFTDRTLGAAVRSMMYDAWQEPGFCVPNPTVYPHQWLWDSCFHAVIWTRLDRSRAQREIDNLLARMGPTGFVPHMIYWHDTTVHAKMWGRSGTSSITQAPMWGMALSEIAALGGAVADDLLERAALGLLHLLDHRPPSRGGLVPVFHPWETGCDDSPRWDGWTGSSPSSTRRDAKFDRAAWRAAKVRLVGSLVFDDDGVPVDNRDFAVGSVGFSSLVAWNCELLAPLVAAADSPDIAALAESLRTGHDRLVDAVRGSWSRESGTWWDEPLRGDVRPSCGVRTLDSMLALLIDPKAAVFDELVDSAAFGAPCGPRGVHRAEPTYDPDQYWRGPAWPQMTYLLWRAARRAAIDGIIASSIADALGSCLVRGARRSGLAEYWNPETGEGRGAAPQCWAGLAICV